MPCVRFLPHQREAIEKLKSGNILCAGVGTGKSITALGYFFEKVCEAVKWSDGELRGPLMNPKPLYIITTARKRDTKEWNVEFDKFDFDVPFTVDSWNNIHKYEDVAEAFFIFDEQRVGGCGAWSKSFVRITKANEWILLSATPGDTWLDYISVFLANGFYKTKGAFLRRHATYDHNPYIRYPKIVGWKETGVLERLRRTITVTMHYEKKTVPHWEDVVVDYDRNLYNRILKDRWNPWEEKPVEDAAGACYLLRRAVNENDIRARKLFWMVMAEHSKAIVFYSYDYELALIKRTFEEMLNLDEVNLKPEDRDFEIAEWNGHKHEKIPTTKKWVYLVQYNAGAEGWNCVETDTLMFFSQSYSYKMMTQAAGRIDRMNTPFTDLYYYVFKSGAPIDQAIDRALRAKKNFNEKLFLPEW